MDPTSNFETFNNDKKEPITVQVAINKDSKTVWEFWKSPEHVKNWCHASPDWYAPKATNDLKVGGKFSTTMAARDGSASFDFEGVYKKITPFRFIEYDMSDGRKVIVEFLPVNNTTRVIQTFDPESENPVKMQKDGWQAILNNFKKYVEKNN
ncbi:MAG: SRPBCC domain-containing protein [Nanoarchaeota archaeon]